MLKSPLHFLSRYNFTLFTLFVRMNTSMSNLMRTTRFWNSFHQTRSYLEDWKVNYFKIPR